MAAAAARIAVGAAIAAVLTVAPAAMARADPQLEISVDGGPYSSAHVNVPLFGQVAVAPGDHDSKRLMVRNAGSATALLTARVADLRTSGDDASSFFRDFEINGTSVAELRAEPNEALTRTELAPGASTAVAVSYRFPVAADSGHAAAGALRLSFDVRVDLTEIAGTSAPPRRSRWARLGEIGVWVAATAAVLSCLAAVQLVRARLGRARRKARQ
ncbi:hypothetical protein ACFOYW_08075 [Gryllotalpicola reticulitermitis]|uniref:DUF916 domain-containing protein n=1 Tax=Gryllotalpicola reticulitermitis TaxID=1184153 RepID=A0ABV8Q6V6_9MICO